MAAQETYIKISRASGSSLVEKANASIALNSFVPIDKVAELKGLKSNHSLRVEINKESFLFNKMCINNFIWCI